MSQDFRFGLPISLSEALRAEASPLAAKLADLIEADGPTPSCPPQRRAASSWQAALTGLALSISLGAQSYAADFDGLQGRWEMTAANSSFSEAVTGPAPDAATLLVTRDDGSRLAYQLIERREGEEVGRGAYDVSFQGATSISSVDGKHLVVTASRDGRGAVTIQGPQVDGAQASIHVRRTGRDTAVLEHDVASPTGVVRLETIALVRAAQEGVQP